MKANQPTLLAHMQETIRTAKPLGCFQTHEWSRGRSEYRRVEVYAAPGKLEWPALRRIIHVVRSGEREGVCYNRASFFATSLVAEVPAYAAGIRGHWLIENRLHWVKDVGMHEDSSGIRSKEAAATLSLLKTWALSLYRQQGHRSLKQATVCYANKVKELLLLIRT